MWILYAFLFLVAAAIIIKTGILREFVSMLVLALIGGGIGALICYIMIDTTDPGTTIGVGIGLLLYLIWCIMRIVNPEESTLIEVDELGNKKTTELSERGEGIAGIVMIIIVIIIRYLCFPH